MFSGGMVDMAKLAMQAINDIKWRPKNILVDVEFSSPMSSAVPHVLLVSTSLSENYTG